MRRLFHVWTLISVLWIASVTGAYLASERSPFMATKPPAQCITAKKAKECARKLEKLGRNPFEAFGVLGSEPLYAAEERKQIKRVALLALLPPASIFLIGVGVVWASKGFARW